jgi:hypothetical protein
MNPLDVDFLKFGQNMITSCPVVMSEAELSTMCSLDFLKTILLYRSVPYQNDTVYFARTAFANRNYLNEWIPVKVVDLIENITYNANTSTCHIPTKYNLFIFYNKMG